jgi:hypothetical protein
MQLSLVKITGETLSNPDGTVRSCQPDGTWQTRPAGTAGEYERSAVNGNTVTYQPVDKIFVFPFLLNAPKHPGFSLVGEKSLS